MYLERHCFCVSKAADINTHRAVVMPRMHDCPSHKLTKPYWHTPGHAMHIVPKVWLCHCAGQNGQMEPEGAAHHLVYLA